MKRPTENPRRQGVALIMALALMAVITVILSVITLQAIAQRRFLVQREKVLQAEWLARSGLEVGMARLLTSDVAFSDDNQQSVAQGNLRIVAEKESGDVYRITADCTISADESMPVARTRQVRVRRTSSGGTIHVQKLSEAK